MVTLQFSKKFKYEDPKIQFGDSENASNVKEWAQLEIAKLTEESNKKLLNIAISAQERLMERIRKDLKQFATDLPTEASQRWIELHTIPGAQPCNSSDHNWVIEQTVTRNRTDEEIKMLTDQLQANARRGHLDIDEMHRKLAFIGDEQIKEKEQTTVSAAAY